MRFFSSIFKDMIVSLSDIGRAFIFSLAFLLLILSSCNRNPLDIKIPDIDLNIEIQRFEKEVFSTDTDSITQTINYLHEKYGDFFDVFSYHVINIGLPSEKEYPLWFGMFITDKLNQEVYNETIKVYKDLDDLEEILTRAFKRYTYHFEGKEVPRIVSYISRFNHSCFTIENYLGVGLDKYLGRENDYYIRMGLPRYQVQNMYREKIPSDILSVFANEQVKYNDESGHLLSRLIHEGKIMYFIDALLPDQEDSLKIGFTGQQMKWCKNNERQMWEYLIENKLIFSSDPMVIQKITGPAPFTYYFSAESPGRAGVWTGWQIVRKFAGKNKHLSVSEIMDEMDYQKILRESGYNPK